MIAQVLNLRPFQTARAAARSAGLDDAEVLKEIIREQVVGRDGMAVAGRIRSLAWQIRNDCTRRHNGPGSAA